MSPKAPVTMSSRAPRAAKTAAKALLDSSKSKSTKTLTSAFKASKGAAVTTTKVTKQKPTVKSIVAHKDVVLKQATKLAASNPKAKKEAAGISTYSSGDITDELPIIHNVNPSVSAAPIKTENSNIAIADPSTSDPATSPSSALLQAAIEHITTADPSLKIFCTSHFCHVFSEAGLAEPIDPFRSLVSGIISQQVSGAAAKSIKNKFISLFVPAVDFPTPKQCLDTPIETLRTAGLSQRKAEYIHSLSEKFECGELNTDFLLTASDEEVTERLVSVRGIGMWSAQMFLLFGLKRGDVFSTGDLGIQKGMAKYKGKDVSKLKASSKGKWKYMSEQDMIEHAEKFKPYRSVFMWYMWRFADTDVQSMKI